MFKTKFYIGRQNKITNWVSLDATSPIRWQLVAPKNFEYGGTETFALDETLDSGITSIVYSNSSTVIQPFTPCKLEFYEDDYFRETNFYFIFQDQVELNHLQKGLFTHQLTLIEPTKILERFILPNNLTFTRTKGYKEYTIKDVIDRCLELVLPLGSTTKPEGQFKNPLFRLASGLPISIYEVAPDFNFSHRNLLEALMEIGRYIGGIPELQFTETMVAPLLINFTFPEKDNELLEKFNGENHTLSPYQYTHNLHSDVSNLVVKDENIAKITFPSPSGYVYPKSQLGELVDTKNMQIFLPTPIYRIDKLELYQMLFTNITDDKTPIVAFHYKQPGDNIYKFIFWKLPLEHLTGQSTGWDAMHLDITAALREKSTYASLPPLHSPQDDLIKESDLGNYQDCAIPWEVGKNTIDISGDYTYKNWLVSWIHTGIPNVVIGVLLNEYKAKTEAIVGEIEDFVLWGEGFYRETMPADTDYFLTVNTPSESGHTKFSDSDNTKGYAFRVEYIPFVKGTINISKKNSPLSLMSNQEADVVDGNAWGRNQQAVLYKTSLPTQELHKIWKTWPTINVGDKINGKFVIQEKRDVLPFAVKSIYTLTAGYNRISQYTALDSKWRETSINTNETVRRDIEINEYLTISTSATDEQEVWMRDFRSMTNWLNNNLTDSSDITVGRFETYDQNNNIYHFVLPIDSLAVGNTMRFSTLLQDYLSVGYKQQSVLVHSELKTITQIVPYTDKHGYCDTLLAEFYHDMLVSTSTASSLPSGGHSNTFFPNDSRIKGYCRLNKDQREELSFIYNLHCLKSQKCGFTEYFASDNPLVSSNFNSNFKMISLKDSVGMNQITYTNEDVLQENIDYHVEYTYNSYSSEQNYMKVVLDDIVEKPVNLALVNPLNHHIYIYCNEWQYNYFYIMPQKVDIATR